MPKTIDSNGSPLADGDTVSLSEDLDVKGAGFTAQRGAIGKGIRSTGDAHNMEGRVNGAMIVLLTGFLERQSG